jgi:hypothetical protein
VVWREWCGTSDAARVGCSRRSQTRWTKLSPTLSRCRQLDTYEFRCRRTLLNEE